MRTVITISRQLGSGGSYVAAVVAQELNLRYLDREILHRAAEIAGFPDEQMIARLEEQEHIPGFLGQMLEALATIPAVPSVPSATLREGYAFDDMVATLMMTKGLSRDEALQRLQDEQQRATLAGGYADLVKEVILECAQRGEAIIVGRGGQVILHDAPTVLHVQIVAPVEIRTQRLVKRLGITEAEAESQIRRSDKERTRYLRHFHDANWQNPMLYDLVLNTAKVSVDLAARLIIQAAQRLTGNLPL